MKKNIFLGLILSIFAAFLVSTVVQAKQERPKGLEDRGPLSKVTFIHHRRSNAKPDGVGGGKKPKSASPCYSYISKGAKWKSTESFVYNEGDSGLDVPFITDSVASSIEEWEYFGGDIFGDFSYESRATFDFDTLDGENVLTFGEYSDPGVIGVTNVWGYFGGSPRTREIVEWDMLLNTSFAWGNGESNPLLMDLQNILTHELGHSAGMADLYETTCTEETMFGYSTEGDIEKRDLNSGDIEGIEKLYN